MKQILTIFTLLFFVQIQAQVKFQQLSLNDAIKLGATSGKPVFAQFEVSTCDQCNDVAEKGLATEEAGNYINGKFIPILITLTHSDRQNFIAGYNPQQNMGSFFISGTGELVHTFHGTSSRGQEYVNHAEKALNTQTESRISLRELDEEWKNNPENFPAMMKNLERRMAIGFATDSLLDVFTDRLPKDSLGSTNIMNFLCIMAPNIFSKAHKTIYLDRDLFNRVWNTIPVAKRISINNWRLYKSIQIAISEKDMAKAYEVASFSAGTYSAYEAGRKAFETRVFEYYKGVKDTAAYLEKAVFYFDKYYMKESVDSIRYKDSISLAMQLKNQAPVKTNSAGQTYITKTVVRGPLEQSYFNDLNAGARLIYSSTKEKKYLDKALSWAKRAMELSEFYPSAYVFDTYARLLYIFGNKDEAISTEEKAVNLLKERKFNFLRYQQVLDAMKKGETLENF